MKVTRRNLLQGAAAAGGTLAMPSYLRAQSAETEITVQYSIPVLFKELQENIARDFMAKNPKIKVTLRAPELGYEEILQRNLRDSITNNLPDVAFHGLNRQRTLEERNIPVDLKTFMDADPQTKELGFSPSLLSLGQVGGKQTGIGFSLSTPILYYNADLVKAAGGDPDKLPSTWDDVLKLAAAVHDPAKNQTGMFFDWTITGNWSWQGLVFSHGGTMLDPTETKAAFTEAPGEKSMRVAAADGGRREDARHQARDHVPGHVRRPHGHLDAVDRAARALQPRDRRPLPPRLRALSAVGTECAAAGRRQRGDDVHQGCGQAEGRLGVHQVRLRSRPARP